MLDPRLGRWLSLDPFAKKYPDISPFTYTANNPILYIDPDGKKLILPSVEAQKIALAVMTYMFGKENGFAIKNNELIHNGTPPKDLTPQQQILFELVNEVLIKNDEKVYLWTNKKSIVRFDIFDETLDYREVEDNTLGTIPHPDKMILEGKSKIGPIVEGYVDILIPPKKMKEYKEGDKFGLDTEKGQGEFSFEHLVAHELGHAIVDIIINRLNGKYKDIDFNNMSPTQREDWAIRFTNTLLEAINKPLETGDGQHRRNDGEKPPKNDVRPLDKDKSKND